MLCLGSGSEGGLLLILVASSRIGVCMNPRVTSKLIRAAEPFRTSWECAAMRLLPSMCADVSSLMLKSVECLITERALVGPRKLWPSILHCVLLREATKRREERIYPHMMTSFVKEHWLRY